MKRPTSFFLIRIFYSALLYPLYILLFHVGAVISPKIRKTCLLRWKGTWLALNKYSDQDYLLASQPTVLIHAASGEFEYAKPILREISKSDSKTEIVVTIYSSSYFDSAKQFCKNLNQPNIQVLPLPWDFGFVMKSFYEKYQIKSVWFSKTDFWPQMIWTANKQSRNTLAFSVFGPKSKLTCALLKSFNAIYTIDQTTADFLSSQGIQSAKAIGDTRWDQVFARIQGSPLYPLCFGQSPGQLSDQLFDLNSVALLSQKIFVAGSTWPKDEATIIPMCNQLLKSGWRIFLVPHEPTPSHVKSLEKDLRKQGLTFKRLSSYQLPKEKVLLQVLTQFIITDSKPPQSDAIESSQVIIVDQVGILADLYVAATLAYIGGGFDRGVHSVMEPLAAGCKTFVGPYFKNNAEAVQLIDPKNSMASVVSITHSQDFSIKLNDALGFLDTSDSTRAQYKSNLHHCMKGLCGATARLLAETHFIS